jgi:hypothetical protein
MEDPTPMPISAKPQASQQEQKKKIKPKAGGKGKQKKVFMESTDQMLHLAMQVASNQEQKQSNSLEKEVSGSRIELERGVW